MQKFNDFIQSQGLDTMAQAYFAQQLTNPDLSLAELKELLNDDAVQKFLPSMTLGDVWNQQTTQTPKHRDVPKVADDCMAFLKQTPAEYHDAEDISAAVGSSPQYINQVLQAGFKAQTLPIMMRRRSNGRGLGTPVYRYVAQLDQEA